MKNEKKNAFITGYYIGTRGRFICKYNILVGRGPLSAEGRGAAIVLTRL